MSGSASNSAQYNKHSNFKRSASETLPSIEITKDEFSRIKDALKKEEFRKLFLDYCEEIQDPVNRQRYEDEIKQFEAERGVDIRFINPEPGFVIKTSVDGAKKCFINIAKSVEVAKPTSEASVNDTNGTRGLKWAIPMAQAGPREDLDAHGKLCRVFDVIFHPDALHLAQRSDAFHKCLIDTALDAVEREYQVNLDRTNLKFPKMQFKGVARPTVIRSLAKNAPAESNDPHPLESIYPPKPTANSEGPKVIGLKTTPSKQPDFAIPKFCIKHRRDVDLAEYTDELDAKLNLTVPRQLIVEIELPLLKSTSDCQLDVTSNSVYLLSERPGARYRLKLDLPYSVYDKQGMARFDVDQRRLCITLPVVQQSRELQRHMHETLISLNREDSGVESDVRDELNSNSGEELLSVAVNKANVHSENTEWIKKVEEKDGNHTDIAPIALGTLDAVATFLKPSLHYIFPTHFDCNVLDNVVSLVLHVRNVQPDSIDVFQTEKSLHVQFSSIGSGYYPTHYAFLLQLPAKVDAQIETFSAEACENNVVLNLNLSTAGDDILSYLAGLDSSDLKSYALQEKYQVFHGSRQRNKPSAAATATEPLSSSFAVSVERSDCEKSIEIEIKPRSELLSSACTANNTTDDEVHQPQKQQLQRKKANRKHKKKNKKRRSLSDSSYDDIKAYQLKSEQQETTQKPPSHTASIIAHATEEAHINDAERKDKQVTAVSASMPVNVHQQKRSKQRSYSECRDSVSSGSTGVASFKGILKHYSRYDARPSISGSSSSIDDCCSYSCSTDAVQLKFSQSFSDIPEENGNAELSESCKKTVRFDKVIKKQVFRLDSSILGQRKKNQKRRNKKQRALQRRLSEGDSVDYEEIKPVLEESNAVKYFKKASENATESTQKDGESNHQIADEKQVLRSRLESESSSDIDINKNSMMFEIDM